MLKALYDYAVWHELTLPEGYINKTIKAYISLDCNGEFIGIRLNDDTEIPCPDIGSLANGKDKSNVLVEKRSVVIPEEKSVKNRFFIDALRSGAEYEPMMGMCAEVLENEDVCKVIRAELDRVKVKDANRISFMVDGRSILDSKHTLEWWTGFRKQFVGSNSQSDSLCLITGKQTVPMTTTTPISGLQIVGGHARGDALICFDKNAFTSYGLKKALNAPVSEEAFAAVKAALDSLVKKAPVEAGAKFIHWYDEDIPEEDDWIFQLFGEMDDLADEEETEEEIAETRAEREQKERTARQKADTLVKAIKSGETPNTMNANYHILMLSGVNGRIMIRQYERGSYQQLRENIMQWYQDISLASLSGMGEVRACKLVRRLISLLKYQKSNKDVFKRVDKELAGITPAVIMAIIHNTELPDTIAARALANIRSRMYASSEDENLRMIEPRAIQWLKVWLLRRERKNGEERLMSTYNKEHPNTAYHCGAIMAVYARIQEKALQNVNAGIVQRYYASASRTPALVLGQLSRLSVYHLDKLEHRGYYLREKLIELYSAVGDSIPATLTLEQQSYFALGFYQMTARLNEKAEKGE